MPDSPAVSDLPVPFPTPTTGPHAGTGATTADLLVDSCVLPRLAWLARARGTLADPAFLAVPGAIGPDPTAPEPDPGPAEPDDDRARARFSDDNGDGDGDAKASGGAPLPLARVLRLARDVGLRAWHERCAWADLTTIADCLPGLILFRDQSTAILEGLVPGPLPPPGHRPGPPPGPAAILIRADGTTDAPAGPPLALDAQDLGPLWAGDLILVAPAADRPPPTA